MTPEELLAAAHRLMSPDAPPATRTWHRACALLTRLALEAGLRRFWGYAEPDAAGCPMHAQLLLLHRYAGAESAAHAREAWYGLSRAVHHHAYELAPTAAELRAWHHTVTRLLTRLEFRTTHPGGTRDHTTA